MPRVSSILLETRNFIFCSRNHWKQVSRAVLTHPGQQLTRPSISRFPNSWPVTNKLSSGPDRSASHVIRPVNKQRWSRQVLTSRVPLTCPVYVNIRFINFSGFFFFFFFVSVLAVLRRNDISKHSRLVGASVILGVSLWEKPVDVYQCRNCEKIYFLC